MKNNQPEPGAVTNADNKSISPEYDPPFLKQLHEIEERYIKEKESFQKEMFHRFKNNLQIITSLLNIQSSYVKDEDSCRMFINSAERVKAIAMIYDKQYQTENLDIICFDKYLKDLVSCIMNNYDTNTKTIRNEISSVDVNLPAKTALSCGLIINELVSNSFKYAFVDRDKGEIRIKLNRVDGEFINVREECECEGPERTNLILTVSDNGVGISIDDKMSNVSTLGLSLVKMLTAQLQGTFQIDTKKGTRFQINFPVI